MRTMVHKSVFNPCLSQVRADGIHLSPPFINLNAKNVIRCRLLLRAETCCSFQHKYAASGGPQWRRHLVASQFGWSQMEVVLEGASRPSRKLLCGESTTNCWCASYQMPQKGRPALPRALACSVRFLGELPACVRVSGANLIIHSFIPINSSRSAWSELSDFNIPGFPKRWNVFRTWSSSQHAPEGTVTSHIFCPSCRLLERS